MVDQAARYHVEVSTIPVTDEREASVAEKLRTALDLAEAGLDVMRARVRRDDPAAAADVIERRLIAWLRERPGAENGDAVGRPAPDRFAAT